MATYLLESDSIKLSQLDLRILVALMAGKMTGYEVGRQCEQDLGDESRLHNNPLYKALDSLVKMELVEASKSRATGNKSRLYVIKPLGRQIVAHKLMEMQNLIGLARERSKLAAKPPKRKKAAVVADFLRRD
jgi:DNA-binding PadR family transcriptional regulator